MANFPRLRQVASCTGCSLRTMCISDDGGEVWHCNRCSVMFGLNRAHLYDDSKPQIAQETAIGVSKQDAELEFQKQMENRQKFKPEPVKEETPKEEKPNDDKSKPTPRRTKAEKTA